MTRCMEHGKSSIILMPTLLQEAFTSLRRHLVNETRISFSHYAYSLNVLSSLKLLLLLSLVSITLLISFYITACLLTLLGDVTVYGSSKGGLGLYIQKEWLQFPGPWIYTATLAKPSTLAYDANSQLTGSALTFEFITEDGESNQIQSNGDLQRFLCRLTGENRAKIKVISKTLQGPYSK